MKREQSNSSRYNLRSGLILYPSQQEAIEKLLTDLTQQTPAHFLLLADVTGQVVSTRGEQAQKNLVGLGSLVAGDLAASHEIARLTGQYEAYQMVLREGQSTHTFICEAGHYLALMVQVSTETPLGWARMTIGKAARRLTEIADTPPAEQERIEIPPEDLEPLKQDGLSNLFNDALDDLWLE